MKLTTTITIDDDDDDLIIQFIYNSYKSEKGNYTIKTTTLIIIIVCYLNERDNDREYRKRGVTAQHVGAHALQSRLCPQMF